MTVKNGELVDENVTNAAFLSRKEDSDTIAKVGLNNADTASITDAQRAINKSFDTSGITDENDVTAKDYSTNNYIVNGDDRKVAIGKLDAALKNEETQRQAFDATKGQPNGFAPLDGSGLVPASYLPTAGLNFRGTWDADTNTPDIIAETKQPSDFWIVSVAGTTDLGGGPGTDSWDIGDWAIWDGDTFYKIDNSDTVISVNGQTGAVVLDADDIAETATRYWDVKNARNESTDPSASNDSTENYVVGSTWFNSTTGTLWLCQDNTATAAVWTEVQGGGGSGGSGINYIENPGAEDDLTGYVTYADGATEFPLTGTAGSPVSTLTRNTTAPLRGVADFQWSKDAADRQGEGFSYEFNVDNADKTSILRITFDYTVSANYEDGDIRIYILDVSNDVIDVTPLNVNATTLNGRFIGEFQTDSVGFCKLCFHTATTNANAYDVHVDNIEVGPRDITSGAVITDWEPATVSWTGTGGNTIARRRRVGDSYEYRIGITATGAFGGVPSRLVLTGVAPDTSKMVLAGGGSSSTGLYENLGFANFRDESGEVQIGMVTYDGLQGSDAEIRIQVADGGGGETRSISATVPWTWAFQDQMNLHFSIPVAGFSSTAKLSGDIGNREIRVVGQGNAGTALTSLVTDVDFIEVTDNTSSWSGTVFTAPESGNYSFDGSLQVTVSSGIIPRLFVDGVSTRINGISLGSTMKPFSFTYYLQKGQQASIRVDGNVTLLNNPPLHYIEITKFQTPETLYGNEIVAARFRTDAGQSIGVGSIDIIDFNDNDASGKRDTHSAVSTGASWRFTAPYAGYYNAQAKVGFNNTTADTFFNMFLYKNGSIHSVLDTKTSKEMDGTSDEIHLVGGDLVYLQPGDYIDVRCSHGNGSALGLLVNLFHNHIAINKVN